MIRFTSRVIQQTAFRRAFSSASSESQSSKFFSDSNKETESKSGTATIKDKDSGLVMGPQQKSFYKDKVKVSDASSDFASENDARFLENRRHYNSTVFPGGKGAAQNGDVPEQKSHERSYPRDVEGVPPNDPSAKSFSKKRHSKSEDVPTLSENTQFTG